MKHGSPTVVGELEGVISAMAHLVAALIAELPEPTKSILLDFVGGDEGPDEELPEPNGSSRGDGPCETDDEDELATRSPSRVSSRIGSVPKHGALACQVLRRRLRAVLGTAGVLQEGA